jgi:hypothetical protein
MKKSNGMQKNAPRFVSENEVLVTKAFAKNAYVFGTPEYKLWKEIKADCKDAKMVTKNIKKNPNKKTSTKNMTYERMAIYIRQQDDAKVLMLEFKKQIALSQVQTNPYRCVLAWFMQTFSNYDDYKKFFEEEAQKEAKKKDIFTVIDFPTSVVEDDEDEDFDMAVNQ